jgi:hypothetical protein
MAVQRKADCTAAQRKVDRTATQRNADCTAAQRKVDCIAVQRNADHVAVLKPTRGLSTWPQAHARVEHLAARTADFRGAGYATATLVQRQCGRDASSVQ